jgi:ABC-type Fe3+ transport system permease subunit
LKFLFLLPFSLLFTAPVLLSLRRLPRRLLQIQQQPLQSTHSRNQLQQRLTLLLLLLLLLILLFLRLRRRLPRSTANRTRSAPLPRRRLSRGTNAALHRATNAALHCTAPLTRHRTAPRHYAALHRGTSLQLSTRRHQARGLYSSYVSLTYRRRRLRQPQLLC